LTRHPQSGSVHRLLNFALVFGLILFAASPSTWNLAAHAQDSTRKIKKSVDPETPELARRLNIKGVARVQLKIAPGGSVTDVKELGGNPVLLDALVKAVKKWKFEPADRETLQEVKYDFIL